MPSTMPQDFESQAMAARMRELVDLLNRASKAYYAEDREIMPNLEYDRLYDELAALEQRLGVVLANSPTAHVGYEAVDALPKERHERPMLSLGKTKSRDELRDWLGGQEGLLSWKLDGLTVVLTYEGGRLVKAVTRGNGEIGEVITPNARVFQNLPVTIPFRGRLILRGEAVIRYSDFEVLNRQMEEQAAKAAAVQPEAAPLVPAQGSTLYKNPRNLCSGSVRQLNSEITAKRRVRLYAFTLVEAAGGQDEAGTAAPDFHNSREEQLRFLQAQGFEVVPYVRVDSENILEAVARFEKEIERFDIPSDGLVLTYDDIAYGQSLGRTAKFPRDSIAFKWADELQETTLREIEWSASRTGLINPVAIFDPVELEGTTVRRASVHNVSIVRSLRLGIGDRITVYKANMIIPQIAENLTQSDTLEIPEQCPVCGAPTQVRQDNDAQVLVCTNADCPAKKLKAFALFTSRNAMNIEGLSEMTLEKFIARGFIHRYDDIYHLAAHREEIERMDGFGEKSYARLQAGVEASRRTTLPRLLYALGIPGIGVANAKLLCGYFRDDLTALLSADEATLSQIDGIGPVLAGAVRAYFDDARHRRELDTLLGEVTIERRSLPPAPGMAGAIDGSQNTAEVSAANGENTAGVRMASDSEADGTSEAAAAWPLSGLTFVITGAVHHFANRDALKDYIEARGGRATGSVTSKTSYLVNNDVHSATGKNKKAKALGVPVISEDDLLAMCSQSSKSSKKG